MRRTSPSLIAGALNVASLATADDSRRIASTLVHLCYRNGNTYSQVSIGDEIELNLLSAALDVSSEKTHVVVE